MKKVLQKISIASVGILTPALVFGADGGGVNVSGLATLLQQIHNLISMTIPVLIALGVLGFMWGVVMYLFGKNKDEGRMFMVWGIIALFVMTSVWGLVGILRGTLFGSNSDNVQNVGIPQIRNNR
jgi:type IV secretory pathway VirB2 component (pilin)